MSATAIGSDGSLYVASVQNGEAIVSKYASGDITSAPGLDAGSGRAAGRRRHRRPDGLGQPGLCLRHHQQRQSHRRRPGQRRQRRPAAAPMPLSSISPTMAPAPPPIIVSYVGTSASDQGGAVTVGSDGTVYLAGTTTGTFAGPDPQHPERHQCLCRRAQCRRHACLDPAIRRRLRPVHRRGAWRWIRSGSSVLDALGLPSGTINLEPVGGPDAANHAARRRHVPDQDRGRRRRAPPPSPSIRARRRIRWSPRSTASWADAGKAAWSITPAMPKTLKITANPGKTIDLISGPADSDALARLGIAAGRAERAGQTAPAAHRLPARQAPPAVIQHDHAHLWPGSDRHGQALDISTKTGADLARSTLLSVMSNIQNIYQKSTRRRLAAATIGQHQRHRLGATTAQIASYNLALSLLGTSSSDAVNNIVTIVRWRHGRQRAAAARAPAATQHPGLFASVCCGT